MRNNRPFYQQNNDTMREAGARMGSYSKNVEALKRRGGLLPQVERTRGAMSVNKPHIAPFHIPNQRRKVFLNLEFFPIHIPYLQGAHGYRQDSQVNSWRPHFKRLTTPGHLLLMFVSTQGSIFDGDGVQLEQPTMYTPGNPTPDTDWNIYVHETTPKGHPYVSAFTMTARYVRDGERTFEPVEVHGGNNSAHNGALNTVGYWVWEIEDGQLPQFVTSITDSLSEHQDILVGPKQKGTTVGGFTVALFNRDSSPIVTYPNEMAKIGNGSWFSTKRNDIVSRLGDEGWSYGEFSDGRQWSVNDVHGNIPIETGDYWQQTWDHDVKATHVSMITLFPWVLYSPSNPSGVLTLDEGLGLDYTISGAVNFFLSATGNYQALGLDLQGVHVIRGMRYTYLGNAFNPPYGNKSSGWNEIVTWYDDPKVGKNVQSADLTNNPIPYHGIFAGGINELFHPWTYIGQTANDQVKAEIYNDMFGGGPWSIAGGQAVIPGLKARLPHIPYPQGAGVGQYFAGGGDGQLVPTVIETVKVVTSGEGLAMPTNLYASGVRVFIDDEDISQFIFGKPSGVIDNTYWRFDDIDISHWVQSAGEHRVVVTCDEGEADVDTRFEVF